MSTCPHCHRNHQPTTSRILDYLAVTAIYLISSITHLTNTLHNRKRGDPQQSQWQDLDAPPHSSPTNIVHHE